MKDFYYVVDTSYLIFYSAYSAFKSYVDQFDIDEVKQTPDFDPTTDVEYLGLFEQRFLECLENPIRENVVFMNRSRYIFCYDCHRKDIWRREIFPEYKINRDTRDTSRDRFNIGTSFAYAKNVVIPKYCEDHGAKILKCPVAEGDDIVAVTTSEILKEHENNGVIILSVDKDMLQLCNDRTVIVDCGCFIKNPKSELEKALKEKVEGDVSASDFLLFKIMIGDKSDSIPNLKRGMGPKNAYKYVSDRDLFRKLLVENADVRKSFVRNKKLISFKEIPEEVSRSIIEEMNDVNVFGRKNVLGS